MSNIDSTSIDATYPVAGQDNNSQGFRDNFNTITSTNMMATGGGGRSPQPPEHNEQKSERFSQQKQKSLV